MEDLMLTYRSLLWTNWPERVASEETPDTTIPAVFNIPISGWWHGEAEVLASNGLPAVTISGGQESVKREALQTQESRFEFTITCAVQGDDTYKANSMVRRMAQNVISVIDSTTAFWVFSPCIFDLEIFHDPTYLSDNYNDILSAYESGISSARQTRWDLEHIGTDADPAPSVPALDSSFLTAAAYRTLFDTDDLEDEWATTKIDYQDMDGNVFTTTPAAIITRLRAEHKQVVRLISDSMRTNTTYKDANGTSLLAVAEIGVYAIENKALSALGLY